jgi:hypothetical protein
VQSALSALLVLVLALPVAAGAPLAYRLPVGDTFEIVTTTDAEMPVLGPVHAVLRARTRVEAVVPGGGMKLAQTITSSRPGKPETTLSLGLEVSPEGRCSNVCGVDMTNPKAALIAKNASVGLPPLPNEPVAVGSSWEDERPVYLPKVPIPGVPEVVRVHSSYKVVALGKQGEKDTVTIAVESRESNGQKVSFACAGTIVVEAATGKPVASRMQGQAAVRVILKTVKVPFKADIVVH